MHHWQMHDVWETHIYFYFFVLQGDVGVPGFKGEAGPKGEPVSFSYI